MNMNMDWIAVGQIATLLLAGIWLLLCKFSQIYRRRQGEYKPMTKEEFFWIGPKYMIQILWLYAKEKLDDLRKRNESK